MGAARDRFMFAQNIIANKGGIENIDLAGEMAKVQAFINIKGLKPQEYPTQQPIVNQAEQMINMPTPQGNQPPMDMTQGQSQNPLI